MKMQENLTFNLMTEYENYSYSKIKQESDYYITNEDIRWYPNCIFDFNDENITKEYKEDTYARETRWNVWLNVLKLFKVYKIKSNLDIGCANNHFSFLCNKNDIFSVGIDPRQNCLQSCEHVFKREFGKKDKYGYVGNIKTFVEFFNNYDEKIFDCISILNFLHGNDHISEEIEQLFNILPKVANYAMLSEPQWNKLGLPKMTDSFEELSKIGPHDHILYKLSN